MYREWPSSLPHTVAWTAEPERHEQHRVMPDGCMDIIWHEGQLVVAGPDTAAQFASWSPGSCIVGLRFGAGVGPRAVGVPAHVLRDQRVPLSDVWAPELTRKLHDQLIAAERPHVVLESAALQAMRRADPPDPLGPYLLRNVKRATAATVADQVGMSVRQLHRRTVAAFGYGPKTLGRIVRMNSALELARRGVRLGDVAAVAGYSDQAHLSREVRALAGARITELLTE